MFFKAFSKKTVKELRKNKGLTAQELALSVRVSSSIIRKIDHLQLKNVPEPVKSKIEPVLKD